MNELGENNFYKKIAEQISFRRSFNIRCSLRPSDYKPLRDELKEKGMIGEGVSFRLFNISNITKSEQIDQMKNILNKYLENNNYKIEDATNFSTEELLQQKEDLKSVSAIGRVKKAEFNNEKKEFILTLGEEGEEITCTLSSSFDEKFSKILSDKFLEHENEIDLIEDSEKRRQKRLEIRNQTADDYIKIIVNKRFNIFGDYDCFNKMFKIDRFKESYFL